MSDFGKQTESKKVVDTTLGQLTISTKIVVGDIEDVISSKVKTLGLYLQLTNLEEKGPE